MAIRTDFWRHMERETPLPVVALVSASAFLLDTAIHAVRAKVLAQAPDFNSDVCSPTADGVYQAIGAAQTLPMMATHRWVHLPDAHRLDAKSVLPLLAYIDKPQPSAVLCLSADKFDQRTKLAMALNKKGAMFSLEPPKPAQLPGWVVKHAQELRLGIDADAASLLVDLCGHDLGMLSNTLEKVALFAGDGVTVTADHVSQSVAATRIASIFALTDAVGQKNWGTASTTLRNILGGGESALVVLTMLTRQLRQLLQVKIFQQSMGGPGARHLAQSLGVRPFVAELLQSQARQYSVTQLQSALAAAAETDVKLKSSRLGGNLLLDGLLVDIMAAT